MNRLSISSKTKKISVTYFFFNVLCNILNIKPAGWFSGFVLFKNRQFLYLCQCKTKIHFKKTKPISNILSGMTYQLKTNNH